MRKKANPTWAHVVSQLSFKFLLWRVLHGKKMHAFIIYKMLSYIMCAVDGTTYDQSPDDQGCFVIRRNTWMSKDVTLSVSSSETTDCPLRDAESVCCVPLSSGMDRILAQHTEQEDPQPFSAHAAPPGRKQPGKRWCVFLGGSQRGNETPTPPHSQGWFPLKLKTVLRLLFLRKLSVTVLHMMFRPEISLGGGKRRKEAEKCRAGRGGMAIVPPVGIWQVMRGGALLIYPHREKTSCWYRWHQDLFSSTPTFLSIHPSTLEPLLWFSFVCIYYMLVNPSI